MLIEITFPIYSVPVKLVALKVVHLVAPKVAQWHEGFTRSEGLTGSGRKMEAPGIWSP